MMFAEDFTALQINHNVVIHVPPTNLQMGQRGSVVIFGVSCVIRRDVASRGFDAVVAS